MKQFLPLLLGLSAAVALVQPARADIFKPSIQDQIKLGRQVAAEIAKEGKLLPLSDPRTALTVKIGNQLVDQIPEKELKDKPFLYSFHVINDKEVNAFAIPGGGVYIYTGLISKMKTEDELAGVIAHEIVHVRNQHWASVYADTVKRKLGINVILTVLGAGDWAFNVADAADTFLVGLPYSRKHELEADAVGYDLMTAIDKNPQGMVDTFTMLSKGEDTSMGDFLRTHPLSKDRVKKIQDRITKSSKMFPAQKPLPANVRLASTRFPR